MAVGLKVTRQRGYTFAVIPSLGAATVPTGGGAPLPIC